MSNHATQPLLDSLNPLDGSVVWSGSSSTTEEVNGAVSRARGAFRDWSSTPLDKRVAFIQAYARILGEHRDSLAKLISQEMGKPLWESLGEVGAMINKVAITIQAYEDRCRELTGKQGNFRAVTRHRPHGVVGIFGPFNFPGHLPNGHIIPALLAGNTIVFKPSELTPGTGAYLVDLWRQVNLPEGVLELVQGGRAVGEALAHHPQLDGLFFTGSSRTGRHLSEVFGRHPEKILALEMGGNNAMIVGSIEQWEAAALLIVQSAYLTSGQRCTCARRLILPYGDQVIAPLRALMGRLRVGAYNDSPEPFMGPVVSTESAQRLLQTQQALEAKGGVILEPMRLIREGSGLLSPGLMDVTAIKNLPDEEYFGPFLQVIRVPSFSAALEEANRTAYGLSAAILTDDETEYSTFYREIRAGIINRNTQTTGASSAMPFGGVGLSGNHRPSAYYASDYCAYPVASLEADKILVPETLPTGIDP